MGLAALSGLFGCSGRSVREAAAALPRTGVRLDIGASFNHESGVYERGRGECMADFRFYEFHDGDAFIFGARGYQFQLALYTDEIDGRYIHTYCYSPEESWATFSGNISDWSWRSRSVALSGHGWARVAVRRRDRRPLSEEDKALVEASCHFARRDVPYEEKPCFAEEARDTAEKVSALAGEGALVLGLLTDSHYVVNGRWEDTAHNLRAVHGKSPFDAVLHLGDFTDGMTPLEITKEYTGRVLSDLRSLGVPVYAALGNHDSNYFGSNPEAMDERAQSEWYLGRAEPHYFVDFAGKKIRLLVLSSFDHTQEGQSMRYGFSSGEVAWAERVLAGTPDGWRVIVVSHVPLLAEMHFWSDGIRNGAEMVSVLEDFNTGGGRSPEGGRILAFIHGHVHSDWVNVESCSFPVVSVGCAKIEDEQEKKVPGSTTHRRAVGDVTQELWDVLVADAESGRLDFVRFGAGDDRTVGAR